MDGAVTIGDANRGIIAVDWLIGGVTDINGDGRGDIISQHAVTGQRYVWYREGSNTIGDALLGVVAVDWTFAFWRQIRSPGPKTGVFARVGRGIGPGDFRVTAPCSHPRFVRILSTAQTL